MIGGNASVTTKAALEAHTVNLGAELAGGGLTVNAFRPGTVDTAMQTSYLSQGKLITPDQAASALLAHLLTDDATGQLWT